MLFSDPLTAAEKRRAVDDEAVVEALNALLELGIDTVTYDKLLGHPHAPTATGDDGIMEVDCQCGQHFYDNDDWVRHAHESRSLE